MQKLIKFYSDNCAPCKAMAPIFWEFVQLQENVPVEEINISDPEGRDKALALHLRGVPSFVAFYEDGSTLSHTGMGNVATLVEKLVK